MFLKNVSKTFQSFSYNDGKRQRQIAPGETVTLIDAKEDDVAIKTLVSFGAVEIVDAPDGSKDEAEPVVLADVEDPNETDVLTTVKCAATFKNGNPCNAVVQLEEGEAYEDAPHFCGRHKDENPEDYELVGGMWVKADKKAKKEAEKPAEKPAEAPQQPAEAAPSDEGGSASGIAADGGTSPLAASGERPVFNND